MGNLADYLPVGFCLTQRRYRLTHPIHSPFGTREGAVLFGAGVSQQ